MRFSKELVFRRQERSASTLLVLGGALGLCLALSGAALADKIRNPTAVYSGLDKITGRIISFEVAINETVQFGSLQITPRVCYTRPPTETPQTDTFVEVDEVTADKEYKRIFSGWMYTASPGLHGIEHPIYDIWLTACKGGTEIIREAPPVTASATPAEPPPPENATPAPPPNAPPPRPRRVVRAKPPEEHREPVQTYFPASEYPSTSTPEYGKRGQDR